MSSLDKMLNKMKTDPINHSVPLPLVDEAFVVISSTGLTFTEKKIRIERLEQQATGYELTCFSDVHESLIVTSSIDELSALNDSEQD